MIKTIDDIHEILRKHNAFRGRCLNLVAAENVTSEHLRAMLTCDLGHRYGTFFDDPSSRNYLGNSFIAEMEVETIALAQKLFHATWVDLRPLGGEMAGKAVIAGLARAGDTVFEVGDCFGAHKLAKRLTVANLWTQSIRVEALPFIESGRQVDLRQLQKRLEETRAKLVILGHSHLTAPEPVQEIKELVKQVGGYLAYDASHVMGLIACGVFPNPLDGGADVVMGSTHKTLPGPQGGIIFTRDPEIYKQVRPALYPTLVTNHHMNRIPALAVVFLELLEYGRLYGEQIINNSKAMGKALLEMGINVLYADEGISETHIVLVDVSQYGKGQEIARRLEEANIICDSVKIPCDFGRDSTSGLRLGTAEATRVGMKENDMREVATFIKRVVVDLEEPERIARDIASFVAQFNCVSYGFDGSGSPFSFPFGT